MASYVPSESHLPPASVASGDDCQLPGAIKVRTLLATPYSFALTTILMNSPGFEESVIILASPDATAPNCGPMSATDSASSMKPEGTDPAHMGTDTRMAIRDPRCPR